MSEAKASQRLTTQWHCDSCGEVIERAEEGWVEWIRAEDDANNIWVCRDLRLVHKDHFRREKGLGGRCQFDQRAESNRDGGIVGDGPLQDYLGPDGLTTLLELLTHNLQKFELMDVLRLIMRLHVPGYETARFHFETAISDGVIDPNTAPEFHSQEQIQRIIEKYGG